MQPATLPPWLSPWSSGLLYGQRVYKGTLRERYRPRDRHRPRLTIYTYNHDDTHNILRIGGWGSGSGTGAVSAVGAIGAGGGMGGGGANTARPLGWERYALEREPWRLAAVPAHAPPPDLYREIHIKEAAPVGVGVGAGGARVATDGGGGGGGGEGGWGAARGWAAGTALLALLVVLARAAENCIDRKFFKMYSAAGARAGRRRSEEWPTPNVFATSQQQSINDGRLDIDSLAPSITVDLPPPYSECTSTTAPKPDYPEEPPPPYSDCYVEFSNKNGIPSVLIFSRRRNSILNRHEIVGSRDEATTSDGRTDDAEPVDLALALDDIRVEERRYDGDNDVRPEDNEVTVNVEHNDQTAQTSPESILNISNVTDNTDTNVGDIPKVSTGAGNTNDIANDNVKIV